MANTTNVLGSFATVTHRARGKKRYSVLVDRELMAMMCSVGQAIEEGDGREKSARRPAGATGRLVGIWVLPTNNVLELYRGLDGSEIGYLFTSLDVWMSFPPSR